MSMQLMEVTQPTLPPTLTAETHATDQRSFLRRDVEQDLWLIDMLGETVLRCRCLNLSAGGLYASAPVGYGLAVGQRYELRLAPGKGRSSSLLLGDTLGYATVIRTQFNHQSAQEPVAFVARFDAPQYLPL